MLSFRNIKHILLLFKYQKGVWRLTAHNNILVKCLSCDQDVKETFTQFTSYWMLMLEAQKGSKIWFNTLNQFSKNRDQKIFFMTQNHFQYFIILILNHDDEPKHTLKPGIWGSLYSPVCCRCFRGDWIQFWKNCFAFHSHFTPPSSIRVRFHTHSHPPWICISLSQVVKFFSLPLSPWITCFFVITMHHYRCRQASMFFFSLKPKTQLYTQL